MRERGVRVHKEGLRRAGFGAVARERDGERGGWDGMGWDESSALEDH